MIVESLAGQPITLDELLKVKIVELRETKGFTTAIPTNLTSDDVMKLFLPEKIFKLAYGLAVDYEINLIEDVHVVLQCFKWMSWCNVTLQAIRVPPKIRLLQFLVDSTKFIRVADERIMKVFHSIVGKAHVWSNRAKKSSQSRALDVKKLMEIVLEVTFSLFHVMFNYVFKQGNAIPTNSRLKKYLKEQLKRYQEKQDTTSTSRARPLEESSEEANARRTSLQTQRVISYTGLVNLPKNLPDSSDDESSASAFSSYTYEEFPMHAYAPPARELWPVKLAFGPVTKTAFRPSNSSHSSTASAGMASSANQFAHINRVSQSSNPVGDVRRTNIISGSKIQGNVQGNTGKVLTYRVPSAASVGAGKFDAKAALAVSSTATIPGSLTSNNASKQILKRPYAPIAFKAPPSSASSAVVGSEASSDKLSMASTDGNDVKRLRLNSDSNDSNIE